MTPPLSHTSSLIMRLAAALRARSGEIADDTVRHVRQELPDYYDVTNPDFQAAGYGALPAVLSTTWSTLENDGRCPQHLPSHLVDEALNAARNDVPWEILDRSYALTHEAIWNAALEEVLSWQLTRGDQVLVLQMSSKFLFRCFDWLTTKAGEVYAGERTEWLDRREKRLREIVSQAIDGLAVPDAELGYGTHQHHIGVVGWGRDPLRAISEAARALGAELLSVPSAGSAVWAWVGRANFPDYPRAVAAFTPKAGTHLALGAIERGRRGFTTTHHQAQLASSVAVRQLVPAGRSVIVYPDVAIEAFALADESRARIFVSHFLGSLAASDVKSARLRQTLRAYCDAGQNTLAAARQLGIAERTVRYRLRTLEDELGGRLATGLLELGLAARVYEALEGQAVARVGTMMASADQELGGDGVAASVGPLAV
jgi:PucR C-terminal helix-turn-helix domain